MPLIDEVKRGYATGKNKRDDEYERKLAERKERIRKQLARQGGLQFDDINDDYLQKYQNDANDYITRAGKDYKKVGYDNASSLADKYSSERDELEERRKWIETYFRATNPYGKTAAKTNAESYLNQQDFGSQMESVKKLFDQQKQYYSQWKTRDDYDAYLGDQEAYKRAQNVTDTEYRLAERFSALDQKGTHNLSDEEWREYNGIKDTLGFDSADAVNRYYNYSRQARTAGWTGRDVDNARRYAELRAKYERDKFGMTTAEWSEYQQLEKNYSFTSIQDANLSAQAARPNVYRDEAVNDPNFRLYANMGKQNGRNPVQYARENPDAVEAANVQGYKEGAVTDNARYERYWQMTDEEASVYSYYIGKYGYQKAEEYAESLTDTLNVRVGQALAEKVAGEDSPEALRYIFGAQAGLDQFGSGIHTLLTGDTNVSPTQVASGIVRERTEGVGKGVYDVVTTTANMLPSIMLSTVTGAVGGTLGVAAGTASAVSGAAGSALLGASAAGNAYSQMVNLGYNEGPSKAYAALIGASEAGLQYLMGGVGKLGGKLTGNALGKLVQGLDNAFARAAIQLGGNMLSEGAEEYLQDILEPVFRNIAYGEKNEFKAYTDEALYSMVLGALTAGLFDGAGVVSENVGTYNTGREVKQAKAVDTLVAAGQQFDVGSVAYKLAGRIDENSNAYAIGQLFREVSAGMGEQARADVAAALERRGVQHKDAVKLADAFAAVVNGENLTEKQINLLAENDTLAEAVRESLVDANTTEFQRLQARSTSFGQTVDALAKHESDDYTNSAKAKQDKLNAKQEKTQARLDKRAAKKNAAAEEYDINKVGETEPDIADDNGLIRTESDKKAASPTIQSVASLQVPNTRNSVESALRTAALPADAVAVLSQGYDAQVVDATTYVKGVSDAFELGRAGIPETQLTSSTFAAELTPTQRSYAYEAGVRAASAANTEGAVTYEGTGAEIYASDGSKRAGSTHTGEQVRGVEGRAGQNQGRETKSGPGSGKAAKGAHGRRVTSAELTGSADGSTKDALRVYVKKDTDSEKARALGKEHGLEVVLFTGGNLAMRDRDGKFASARGYIDLSAKRVYVRADHPDYTADQIVRHEVGHLQIANGELNTNDVRDKLRARFTPEQLDTIASLYLEAFAGTDMTEAEIWEELVCDSLGDMNIFHGTFAEKVVGEAIRIVRESAENSADKSHNKAAAFSVEPHYSIETLPDGRKYVQLDRQVLTGDDPELWEKQMQAYINEQIRGGKDVTLVTADGHTLALTATSAWKLTDRHKSQISKADRFIMDDTSVKRKLSAVSHIDEIVRVGYNIGYQEDINQAHANKVGADGFRYYTAYFMDADQTYYRIQFSAGINKAKETVYSVGKTDKRKNPIVSNGSSSTDAGALDDIGSFTDSISDSAENVNPSEVERQENFSLETDKSTLREIADIVERGEYEYYGLRVDEVPLTVGSTADASHNLYQDPAYDENGELVYPMSQEERYRGFYDGGEMAGTSSVRLTADNIRDAVNTLRDKYYGSYMHVIAGNSAAQGEDVQEGEIVIPSAKVLARYSLGGKMSRESAVLDELRRENEQLKARVDYWRGQTKTTREASVRTEDIARLSKQLKKTFNSSVDASEINARLQALGDYIVRADSNQYSWETLTERARSMSELIIKDAHEYKEIPASYADAYHDITSTTWTISKDDLHDFGGIYAEIRKPWVGTLKVKLTNGTSRWDTQYQILAEEYSFPEAHTARDALEFMYEYAQTFKQLRDTPAHNDALTVETVASTIIDGLLSENVRRTPKTFADKQAAKLDRHVAEVRAEERQKGAAALRGEQAQAAWKLKMAEANARQLIKEERQAKQEALDQLRAEKNARIEKLLADASARLQRRVAAEKQAKKEALDALMQRHLQSKANARDSRNRTEMRHQIGRIAQQLSSLLLNSTKYRNMPEGLRGVTAQLMETLNMDDVAANAQVEALNRKLLVETDPTKRGKLLNQLHRVSDRSFHLDELLTAYRDIRSSSDPALADAAAPEVDELIQKAAKDLGGISVYQMTTKQLQRVLDVYTTVLTTIRNANTIFRNGRRLDTEKLAVAAGGELRAAHPKDRGVMRRLEKTRDAVDRFAWNNEKPIYAFEKMGSRTLLTLFNDIRRGEDVWGADIREAARFKRDTMLRYGYSGWDMEATRDFPQSDGSTVTLTLGQIMSLYAYSKREAAAGHLTEGGFILKDAVAKKGNGKSAKYAIPDPTPHVISAEALKGIVNVLSKSQRGYVDTMQKYLSETMGAKGNEVAMILYGTKLFREENYFPMSVSDQYLQWLNEKPGASSMRNKGFTNAVQPGAVAPLVLSDFMETWAGHVNDMSMYHGFVVPVDSFMRVYNYRHGNASLKTELNRAFGRSANEYIQQLMTDLNGGARAESRERGAKLLVGRFKRAAVFLSGSVVIQQPSAIGRALAMIDTRYFFGKDVGEKHHRGQWEELKKYAPVAYIKELGYFDTDVGGGTVDMLSAKEYEGAKDNLQALRTDKDYRKDKLDEAMSKLPSKADEYTWTHIWNAVKRETAHRRKDLQVGSEEFLQAAGNRFTDIIVHTQVYDSVLSRSANMRSKSVFMQMLTSFMAEPTTTANMVENAGRMARKGQVGAALKTVKGVLSSIVLNTALVSIVYAMRDDDDDETFLEKYLSSATGEFLESVNPVTYIPLLKDIWSLLQGYDIERADMTLIAKLVKNFQYLGKAMGKDTYGMDEEQLAANNKAIADEALNTLCSALALGGVPATNIKRAIGAITNTIGMAQSEPEFSWTQLGKSVLGALNEAVPFSSLRQEDAKALRLYNAIVNGDKDYAARIEATYTSDESYNTAMRKMLRENDPRIEAAAQARFDGDIPTYTQLVEALIAEDNFSQDNILAAVEKMYGDLTPDEESEPQKKGIYKAADFVAALGEDKQLLDKIYDEIIETKITNGKTREDAEKALGTSIKTETKTQYIAGGIGATEARRALTGYLDYDSAETNVQLAKWDFEIQHDDSYEQRMTLYTDALLAGNAKEAASIRADAIAASVTTGKTREDAADSFNSAVKSSVRDLLEDGRLTATAAREWLTKYAGETAEDAHSDVQYWAFKLANPDTNATSEWLDAYNATITEIGASPAGAGISQKDYIDYRNAAKGVSGKGKKERILAIIDAMKLTPAQKDALYYDEDYAASTIGEAPWH